MPSSFKRCLTFSGHITSPRLPSTRLFACCSRPVLGFLGNPAILQRFASSLTHMFRIWQLPLTNTKTHLHKAFILFIIFTVNAHTLCHNADLLSSCLCNGWVEWAGAHTDGSYVAVSSLGSDYSSCIPSLQRALLHSD